MGKSGCSLPDFSKRLREATFFVAFRSRGISIARPGRSHLSVTPRTETVKRGDGANRGDFLALFDLETIFAAASDALIGKVRVISYQFTHSSLGSFFKLKKLWS